MQSYKLQKMINIGSLLLYITAALCIFSAIKYTTSRNHQSAHNHTLLQFSLLTIALLKLINLHINTDYRFSNVIQNSHELIPIIYKITGVWANHSGSMLLLVWSFSLINFLFSLNNKFTKQISAHVLSLQSIFIFCLLSIILITSNPFELSGTIIPEGKGFNPLLQDIGLTIHPPILYLGYAALSIPASLSFGLIAHKIKLTPALLRHTNIWMILPWSFLAAGVSLGSWWAYRELGWGGFWFWDPVENVSLLIWISSTICLHLHKLSITTLSSHRWFFIANTSTFLLSFFTIILVRSGMLASVHSFAFDPEKGIIMSAIFLLLLAYTIVFMYRNLKYYSFSITIPTRLLTYNILLLACAGACILIGLIYPVLQDLLYGNSISISESFYTSTLSIFFLPLSYLTGTYSSKGRWEIISFLLLSTFTTFLINYTKPLNGKLTLLYLHSATFLCIALLYNARREVKKLSMFFSHLGFAALVLGGALHYGYETKDTFAAELNKSHAAIGYSFTLKEIEYAKSENYISRKAHIEVSRDSESLNIVRPEIRFYPIEKMFTIESDTLHTLAGDIYITLGELNKDKILVEVQLKPFIYLIWMGGALMAFSILTYTKRAYGNTKVTRKN